MQTYFAINTALGAYLTAQGVKACPIYQAGVDPATLKDNPLNTTANRYPYIQTWLGNVKQQSWTSRESGVLTDFDFQLSFFTSPKNEFENTEKYFYPFEVAKNGLSDIKENILLGIATIKTTEGPFGFEMKSGQGVPSSAMLYRMRTVCAYAAVVPPATLSTDLDDAISITQEG